MLETILLQAGGGGGFMGLMPFLLIIVVMYLFFFRPQQKKQKEEKQFREEISKGMRVVTTSGIHGKILEIKDNTIVLESENSRIRLERTAISKELSAQYQANTQGNNKKEDSKKEDPKKEETKKEYVK